MNYRVSCLAVVFTLISASKASSSPPPPVDLALISGSGGREVVIRSVALIYQSGMFRRDAGFLRRLAHIQSADGLRVTTNYSGGIWRITRPHFIQTQRHTCRSDYFYEQIRKSFNIEWQQATYDQLDIPIYSALAARLYVEISCRAGVIPTSLPDQYDFWVENYRNESDPNAPHDEDEFERVVREIPRDCSVRRRDVVMAVDASLKSSSTYVRRLKEFLISVVNGWPLGGTRVALVQFAAEAHVVLPLVDGVTIERIEEAINSMQMYSTEEVDVGLALNQSIDAFCWDRERNHMDHSVSKVVLLVTEALAGDFNDSGSSATANNIDIISVMIGNSISEEEMQRITGGTGNCFRSTTYNKLLDVANLVQNAVCDGKITISSETSHRGNLAAGESVIYRVPATFVISVNSSSGHVCAYTSTNDSTPTAAHYESLFNSSVVRVVLNEPSGNLTGGLVNVRIENNGITPATFNLLVAEPTQPTTTSSTLFVPTASDQESFMQRLQPHYRTVLIAGLIVGTFLLLLTVAYLITKYCCGKKGKIYSAEDNQPEQEPQKEPLPEEVKNDFGIIMNGEDIRHEGQSVEKSDEKPVVRPSIPLEVIQQEFTSGDVEIVQEQNLVQQDDEAVQKINAIQYRDELEQQVITKQQDVVQRQDVMQDEDLIKEEVVAPSQRVSTDLCIDEEYTRPSASAHLAPVVNAAHASTAVSQQHQLAEEEQEWTKVTQRYDLQHNCKAGLMKASASRDIHELKRVINDTKSLQTQFQPEFNQAETLLNELIVVEDAKVGLANAIRNRDIGLTKLKADELREVSRMDNKEVERFVDVMQLKVDLEHSLESQDLGAAEETVRIVQRKGLERELRSEMESVKTMQADAVYFQKVTSPLLQYTL